MDVKKYEKVCKYFYKRFKAIPSGCPQCQPNGSDADGYTTITVSVPKLCPGCGKPGTRFYINQTN